MTRPLGPNSILCGFLRSRLCDPPEYGSCGTSRPARDRPGYTQARIDGAIHLRYPETTALNHRRDTERTTFLRFPMPVDRGPDLLRSSGTSDSPVAWDFLYRQCSTIRCSY